MGDHWVGTFALLALEAISTAARALGTADPELVGLQLPEWPGARAGEATAGPIPKRRRLHYGEVEVDRMAGMLFEDGVILRPSAGGHVEERNWLYVEGGVVTQSGAGAAPAALRESVPRDQVVQLRGQVVLPGLADAHIHVFALAREHYKLSLEGCRSIGELQDRLRKHLEKDAAPLPLVEGSHWDQDLLGALPCRTDLDEVCPDLPVVLTRRCWHVCVANSKALSMCGITAATEVEGGAIDRDPAGEPTGILREGAQDLLAPLTRREVPFEDTKRLLFEALQLCVAQGITSVHTNDSKQLGGISDAWAAYSSLADEGRLPCRVFLTTACTELGEASIPQVPVVHPSGMLSCDRVKLWTDGALGARTAAMLAPYADDPGNYGILQMTPDEIDRAVYEAKRRGFRIEAHAIGDASAAALLRCFRQRLVPADRPVITHCQFLSPLLIQSMAQLGVVANVQPQFVPSEDRKSVV